MKKLIKNQGFGLIKLLILIVVIGLLTVIVIIGVKYLQARARDSQRVSDIEKIADALDFYHNNFNTYLIYDDYIEDQDNVFAIALVSVGAIDLVPVDPLNTNDYRYYYQSLDGHDYILEYYLETNSIPGKTKDDNPQYFIP